MMALVIILISLPLNAISGIVQESKEELIGLFVGEKAVRVQDYVNQTG